jgi:hypothetical protein
MRIYEGDAGQLDRRIFGAHDASLIGLGFVVGLYRVDLRTQTSTAWKDFLQAVISFGGDAYLALLSFRFPGSVVNYGLNTAETGQAKAMQAARAQTGLSVAGAM